MDVIGIYTYYYHYHLITNRGNSMYKSEKTSYLVREIPVSLWKNVRAKALRMGKNSMADVIIDLLTTWENRKDWLDES